MVPVNALATLTAIAATLSSVHCLQPRSNRGVMSLATNVKQGEFPFAARVIVDNTECMGTIATKFHVLTACHCIAELPVNEPPVPLNMKKCFISAGTIRKNNYGTTRKCRITEVHKYCQRMSSGLVKYDIGVVTTDERQPWIFGPNIQPFNISTHDRKKLTKNTTMVADSQENCYVLGWGQHVVTVDDSESKLSFKALLPTSPVLKKLVMHVLPSDTCEEIFRLKMGTRSPESHRWTDYDTDAASHLCALPDKNHSASCFGDSGSPLVCGDKFVIGVVSVDTDCSFKLPSLYTRIVSFLDLEKEMIKLRISSEKRVKARSSKFIAKTSNSGELNKSWVLIILISTIAVM